jgi:tripartite-type tricarboxylate transporter receptor subunit TctC
VRIILGFPEGTGADIVARLLAQKLSEAWGNMDVIMDNKPGAGGLIAAIEAAGAISDGYMVILAETGQLSIAPSSYNKLLYDPVKDFTPVSRLVSSEFALLRNPLEGPSKTPKSSWPERISKKGLFKGDVQGRLTNRHGTAPIALGSEKSAARRLSGR